MGMHIIVYQCLVVLCTYVHGHAYYCIPMSRRTLHLCTWACILLYTNVSSYFAPMYMGMHIIVYQCLVVLCTYVHGHAYYCISMSRRTLHLCTWACILLYINVSSYFAP